MSDIFFSPAERRGIIVLLALFALSYLSVDAYLSHLQSKNKLSDEEKQAFLALILEHEEKATLVTSTQYVGALDPNSADRAQLVASGLSEKIADRLINFRNKGAFFAKKSDLEKVYGIDARWIHSPSITFLFSTKNSFEVSVRDPKFNLKDLMLSNFDPNTITKDSLLEMHLPMSAIKGILSFREKYRPFQKPNDIFQVYTIDPSLAKAIIPFIEIKPILVEGGVEDTIQWPISINQADTNLLIMVNGIGTYFAKSIVDYRHKLGGFYSVEQLRDLYTIDSGRFESLANQFFCDTGFRKININRDSEETLYAHPYISYKLARNIVEFRERMRLFKKPEELVNIELVDGVLFSKLAPYLETK